MLNLDTHILIHAFADTLTPRERNLLSNDQWGISAIVLWEVAKLAQLGRIALEVESSDFMRAISKLHIWPIDWAVSYESTRLDFHGDPADELIAATSVVHEVRLVTRDRAILASQCVPLAE